MWHVALAPDSSDALLAELVDHLRDLGRSTNTQHAYRRRVAAFLGWVRLLRRGTEHLHWPADAVAFHDHLRANGTAAATLNQTAAALDSFASLLGVPTAPIERMRLLYPPKYGFAASTRARIRSVEGGALRAAVAAVFLDAGLTVAEARELRVFDLDLDTSAPTIGIRETRPRTVAITVDSARALAGLVRGRHLGDRVFPATRADAAGARALHHVVASIGDRLGLPLCPRELRHASIAAEVAEGRDYHAIAQRHGFANPRALPRSYPRPQRVLAGSRDGRFETSRRRPS